MTKSDGGKFGKTEEGNIWLDPIKTSPYNFYQFWLNISDEDALKYIKIFSMKERSFIEDLIKNSMEKPEFRILQNHIADELTELVHSKESLNIAKKTSKILFGKSTFDDLKSLDKNGLESISSAVPNITIPKKLFENSEIIDLLSTSTNNKIFSSKSEIRRMIKDGGVSINKVKVDENHSIKNLKLLDGKYLLIQKGKKKYYFIIIK